jgi:hypothetical protein
MTGLLVCLAAAEGQTQSGGDLEAVRLAILQDDYQSAFSQCLAFEMATQKRLASAPPGRGLPKRLPDPSGLVDRSGLLVMLEQVRQMDATGDVRSTLMYIDTFLRALHAVNVKSRPTAAQKLEEAEQGLMGVTRFERFLKLPMVALYAVDAGALEKARNYSTELFALAAAPEAGWTAMWRAYAVHIGHAVAGRLDLRNGDLAGAKAHLAEASEAYGGTDMGSLRPEMSLASELLDRGEKAAVLAYLAVSGKSWKLDKGRTATWTALIEQGKRPSFVLSTH